MQTRRVSAPAPRTVAEAAAMVDRRPSRLSNQLLPLLKLGKKIGQGANCEVMEAVVGQNEDSPAMGWPARMGVPDRLAVKVTAM